MSSRSFDLAGQVAVVTGAARGIGLAVARRLAEAGAAVAVVDLTDTEEAAATLAAEGHRALACACDVTDEAAVTAMVARVVEELGGLQVLVCSAGIVGRNAFAWETSLAEWRQVLDVNATGVWLCNRAALGPMRAAGYGRVVNIASIAGKEGNPRLGPYSASKAAVIGLTKSLAKEVADTGIRLSFAGLAPRDIFA